MSTAEPTVPLLPGEKPFPLTLLLFGGLSFLAHAATFFLFQVSYPSRVTIPPQTPQVSLLTGDTPEQQSLLRWIESEDPALVAASSHPVPARLFETPYRPSYMTPRTAPRSMPVQAEKPERPPGPELQTLLKSVVPAAPSPAAPVGPARTHIVLSGGLSGRQLAKPPSLKTRAAGPLEDVSVLLGVSAEGDVRYAFLQRSSGDHPTDAATVAELMRSHLQPVDSAGDLTWGLATIVWGDDAYPEPGQ